MFGFLNVDKSEGISSHKVVSDLRRILNFKKIGHAGTLDPLATGVLPIAVGNATRLLEYLPDNKEYIADMQFGFVSETCDRDSELIKKSDNKIYKEDLLKIIPDFIGEIEQIPPLYSAIHVDGKRLYELARKGKTNIEIPKRIIKINFIELINFNEELRTAQLKINCEKGTYIRSIVRDIGEISGIGAVMTNLRRTKSSGFDIEKSLKITNETTKDFILSQIIPPEKILNFPKFEINDKIFEKVKNGNSFQYENNDGFYILMYENRLKAVAKCENNVFQPIKVF